MPKKFSYKYVKEQFEERGYILLSSNYINSREKLKYICSAGHECSITYRDFQTGRGCRICGLKRGGIKRRLCFSIVGKSFEKEGFKVFKPLEGYKGVEQKLEYVCSFGHKHFITFHNWNSGWRCPTCHHINNSGEKHSNWKGGISFEPYCSAWKDKEYKNDIKERDGNKCLNPYCNQISNKLVLHHIDYNKKNCKPSNLITVCNSCNSRANYNRTWHKAWYRTILFRKYNYIY